MKKNLALSIALVLVFLAGASTAFAQGAARQGPDPATMRDPEIE